MHRVLTLILVLATVAISMLAQPVAGSSFVALADELLIPVPDNWFLATDSAAFPFQFVYGDDGAELLIFRSTLPPEEVITSAGDLKATVDEIVSDIILDLPEATLLSSTGLEEAYRAQFALEFEALDSAQASMVHHRLCGILFRRASGEQSLYTVWGRASKDLYPQVEADIIRMQSGISSLADAEPGVFQMPEQRSWWPVMAMLLFVMVMVFWIRRKKYASRLPALPEDSNFWRCHCGRLNHNTRETCRRCGRTNESPIELRS